MSKQTKQTHTHTQTKTKQGEVYHLENKYSNGAVIPTMMR
jgi:hypothetical protein